MESSEPRCSGRVARCPNCYTSLCQECATPSYSLSWTPSCLVLSATAPSSTRKATQHMRSWPGFYADMLHNVCDIVTAEINRHQWKMTFCNCMVFLFVCFSEWKQHHTTCWHSEAWWESSCFIKSQSQEGEVGQPLQDWLQSCNGTLTTPTWLSQGFYFTGKPSWDERVQGRRLHTNPRWNSSGWGDKGIRTPQT